MTNIKKFLPYLVFTTKEMSLQEWKTATKKSSKYKKIANIEVTDANVVKVYHFTILGRFVRACGGFKKTHYKEVFILLNSKVPQSPSNVSSSKKKQKLTKAAKKTQITSMVAKIITQIAATEKKEATQAAKKAAEEAKNAAEEAKKAAAEAKKAEEIKKKKRMKN